MTTPRRATQQQQKHILLVYELLWGNQFLYLYNKTFERNQFIQNSKATVSHLQVSLFLILAYRYFWPLVCTDLYYSDYVSLFFFHDHKLFKTMLTQYYLEPCVWGLQCVHKTTKGCKGHYLYPGKLFNDSIPLTSELRLFRSLHTWENVSSQPTVAYKQQDSTCIYLISLNLRSELTKIYKF